MPPYVKLGFTKEEFVLKFEIHRRFFCRIRTPLRLSIGPDALRLALILRNVFVLRAERKKSITFLLYHLNK